MLQLALAVLALALVLALLVALRGPSVYDRILAANGLGSLVLLILLTYGFHIGQPEFYVDIALLYSVIGLVSNVAVLRYVEFGGFLATDVEHERDKDSV